MRPRAYRPEEERRDARSCDQRRVRPERHPDDRVCAGRCDDGPNELVTLVDLEPVTCDEQSDLGVPGGGAQVALDLGPCLSGQRAPLARQEAALGVARELLTAFDQRGVQRGWTDERVPPARLEPLVELLERDEHVAHLRDRVDAEIGAGPVCGDTARLDLEARESAVGNGDLELGGLADDRRIRPYSSKNGLGA